jgi:hypothetical protein
VFDPSNLDSSGTEFYLLTTASPWRGLDVTSRLGWTRVDIDDESLSGNPDMSGLTPGIGVSWSPGQTGTTLRAALSRTITVPYAGSQTLRPTQLAGFNQILDEWDGTRADQVNFGLDQRITTDVTVGGVASFRWLSRELTGEDDEEMSDARDDRVSAYAYWTPSERWAFTLQPMYEWYHTREEEVSGDDPYDVRTLTVPLTAAWFHPSGLYAFGSSSVLAQEIENGPSDGASEKENDWGVLVDLGIGYRLPRRYGTIGLRVDNLLDQHLSFQDESLRTNTELNPRFLPARTFLLTATLNF